MTATTLSCGVHCCTCRDIDTPTQMPHTTCRGSRTHSQAVLNDEVQPPRLVPQLRTCLRTDRTSTGKEQHLPGDLVGHSCMAPRHHTHRWDPGQLAPGSTGREQTARECPARVCSHTRSNHTHAYRCTCTCACAAPGGSLAWSAHSTGAAAATHRRDCRGMPAWQ